MNFVNIDEGRLLEFVIRTFRLAQSCDSYATLIFFRFTEIRFWIIIRVVIFGMVSCITCGKEFSSSYNLKRHVDSTHNPARTLTCFHCYKEYIREDKLKAHEKTCKQEKACRFCGLRLANQVALSQHVTSIHGDGKFQCNECQKKFTRKIDMSRHKYQVRKFQLFQWDELCKFKQ